MHKYIFAAVYFSLLIRAQKENPDRLIRVFYQAVQPRFSVLSRGL